MDRIGVVDTMFARYDMGTEALDELADCPGTASVSRWSDGPSRASRTWRLPPRCSSRNTTARIVVALGMPGKAPVDKVCAHEASQGS